MSVISVEHLSKDFTIFKKKPGITGSISSIFHRTYETITAVSDVSFSIEEGELVGFIGPNGAGKTTTLKMLTGLLYPTSGDIKVLGFTPSQRKTEFLKKLSLVMGQKNQLWWDLPATDSFLLEKAIFGISDNEYKKRLNELVELLDVGEFVNTPVKKLSLGQRMKMELIAGLLHRPQVLFLDEPTIGLDVIAQKSLREFIKDYNQKYNATIILTSHYMKDVASLCKRVIIINHGGILFDGDLQTLINIHSPYKEVKVVFSHEVHKKDLDQLGKIVNHSGQQVTFLVKRDDIGKILSILPQVGSIDDLLVQEPDIEEIIRQIFVSA